MIKFISEKEIDLVSAQTTRKSRSYDRVAESRASAVPSP
jgi:hypothetical protein